MKPYVFSMCFSICLCRILFYDACQLILHAFVISKKGLCFRQLSFMKSVYNISVFTAALKGAGYFIISWMTKPL